MDTPDKRRRTGLLGTLCPRKRNGGLRLSPCAPCALLSHARCVARGTATRRAPCQARRQWSGVLSLAPCWQRASAATRVRDSLNARSTRWAIESSQPASHRAPRRCARKGKRSSPASTPTIPGELRPPTPLSSSGPAPGVASIRSRTHASRHNSGQRLCGSQSIAIRLPFDNLHARSANPACPLLEAGHRVS